MSQSDYNLLNQLGANFRAELNTILQSSQEKNSALTEPATRFAYQWWADTTTGLLKMRNSANTGWITVMSLTDAVNASQVVNAPAGNIVATTLQDAIAELDAEKAGLALANNFTARQTWKFGAVISPAAGILTLGTDGNAFHIGGTAQNITDITHITGSGPFFGVADVAHTWKHAAGVLETNTGADILMAAGDRFRMDQDSDNTTWLITQEGAASGGGTPEVIHVQDQKTNGTNGGSSVVGQQTRTLNTVVTNTITGASLASNQITLPAGTYEISGGAPAFNADAHKIRLYNVTDTAVALVGSNAYSRSVSSVQNRSVFNNHRFVLAATKALRIEHYCATANATSGLGVAVTSGDIEVYTDIRIEKVA